MATLDKLLERTLSKDAYWPINKHMVKQIGLEASLILQHIMELKKVFKKNEIFQSQPEMAKELGITEYAIKNRVAELVKLGLISVVKKGTPCKNYYSTNTEKIVELMENEVNELVDTKSTDLLGEYENNEQVDTKSTDSGIEINGLVDTKSTDLNLSNQRTSEYEIVSTNTKNTNNNTNKNTDKEDTANSSVIDYESIFDKSIDERNPYEAIEVISLINQYGSWKQYFLDNDIGLSVVDNYKRRFHNINNSTGQTLELNFNK